MMEGLLLQQRLDNVRAALRQAASREAMRWPLVVGTLTTMLLTGSGALAGRPLGWLWVAMGLWLWVLVARWRAARVRVTDQELARQLEAVAPEFEARLLTAVDLLGRASTPEPLSYLERRVVQESLDCGTGDQWVEWLLGQRLLRARRTTLLAGLFFMASLLWLAWSVPSSEQGKAPVATVAEGLSGAAAATSTALEFIVKPGDTEVERGSRLVVDARIRPQTPQEATLVWFATTAPDQVKGRATMVLGIDGETFGALIPKVSEDLTYLVEAAGSRSQRHTVATFEYPKLERLDVVIVPPESMGLPEREIRNTLKVSAPEGSRLRFRARINKPVAQAELFAADKTVIALTPSAGDATLLEGEHVLDRSRKLRLHLVDDRERANVKPPWITLTAQANALAKIEVVFPKRDLQVSALQELSVEARVWDDASVLRSGATLLLGGQSREVVFSHPATAAGQKQTLRELVDLEKAGVKPRDLISYHFWAEDQGAKGEVRRAMSDMFFAQVRPFDEVFRESEPPPSSPGEPGKGAQAGKLLDLQKQVVNATWKVLRDVAGGRSMESAASDAEVVRESQGIALEQTKQQMEEVEDPEIKQALTEAWKAMRDAIDALEKAAQERQRPALTQALEQEQAALQWLHQAAEHEHRVARQSRNQPSSGGQQERQDQLMNLELKQEEQRYEEARQATAEQAAEQKENLAVLNRLKELARRQEALAKKMQELREQLAAATAPEQRESLNEQLQRLQEEQQDLLNGLDDLRDQMDQSERQQELAETREQLEAIRQQAQSAAEEMAEKELANAANAAIRAERGLKDLEEEFREKTAQRFTEEMRQLKREAKAVAEAQQAISQSLEDQKTPEGAERGDTSNALDRMLAGSEAATAILEQKQRVSDLLENMRQISEQAEQAEPILSRKLYEAVRSAQTSGLEEQLEEARMQSRYGNRSEAQEAERKAATAVEQLGKNVEKAAEAVLGSESEGMRLARDELDRLIEDTQQEAAPNSGEQDRSKGAQSPKVAEGTAPTPSAGQPIDRQGNEAVAGQPETKSESNPLPTPGGRSTQKPPSGTEDSQDVVSTASEGGKSSSSSPSPQNQSANPSAQPGQAPAQASASASASASAESNPASRASGQPGEGASPDDQATMPDGRRDGPEKSSGLASAAPTSPSASSAPEPNGTMPSRSPAAVAQGTGGNLSSGGGGGGRQGWFFDEATELPRTGPITGEGYRDWADRLQQVQELLTDPTLANEAARVADEARAMRVDHQRNNEPPQADELRTRISEPLVELRNRVLEELARKGAENPNVPIDRDPVPPAFRDLVRRYYTELGEGR